MVEARLTDAIRRISTDLPASWSGVRLESARDRYSGELRPVLLGVAGAATLVLIIVFANVSALAVLRTLRRQPELAVRVALGSTRGQLAGMLAAEASVLALLSLSLGLVLTELALGWLAPLIETELGRPAPGGIHTIGVDGTVAVVVLVVGVVLALALSLVPLLLAGRRGLAGVLRPAATSLTGGRSIRRWRSAMLAVEVSFTLILLVGSGLMIRSVTAMVRTDLGFEPERLVRARIALRSADYADDAAFSRFFEQFTKRASAITGFPVVFSSWPLFVAFPEHAIEIDGRDGHVLSAGAVNAGPGYFATLGIALRQGRDFTWDDMSGASPIAVISESLARRLWPHESPLGKSIRQVEVTAGGVRPPGPWQTVVGVAADVRQTYGDENLNDIYTPWLPHLRYGSFYLQSGGRTEALLPILRTAAAEIDSHAAVDLFHAVAEDNRELAATTFLSVILGVFAAVSAFIAILGLYAATAYAAQQREREVAIRMALGADRRAVIWLFVREAGVVLAAGFVLGLLGAWAMMRFVEHQVFAADTFGRSTMAATCVLLAIPCLVATWWPASRASRRSPTTALKDV
jgi:putative ABC transport system permease protein